MKTVRDSWIASVIATVLSVILYMFGGFLIGLYMFNEHCTLDDKEKGCIPINSNVLLSFSNDLFMTVIMLLYSIVILVSYPCMLFSVRESVMNWFGISLA